MWFTTILEGKEQRVMVFMTDIDVIQSGYDPYEFDGHCSVIYTKSGDEVWVVESEKEIDEIFAAEKRKDLLYLFQ